MDGVIKAHFDFEGKDSMLAIMNLENGGRVQQAIDRSTIEWCEKYSPWKTGALALSPYSASQVGSGTVIYDTPYAKRLYYNPQYNFDRTVNPLAGGYWFERAKADHVQDILKEAMDAAGK